jgi:hypothetical protein
MTCDRPLVLASLGDPKNGSLFLPIGPRKLFVAANTEKLLSEFSKGNPSQVVERVNEIIVGRARRLRPGPHREGEEPKPTLNHYG